MRQKRLLFDNMHCRGSSPIYSVHKAMMSTSAHETYLHSAGQWWTMAGSSRSPANHVRARLIRYVDFRPLWCDKRHDEITPPQGVHRGAADGE